MPNPPPRLKTGESNLDFPLDADDNNRLGVKAPSVDRLSNIICQCQHSNQLNQARLAVLKAMDDHVKQAQREEDQLQERIKVLRSNMEKGQPQYQDHLHRDSTATAKNSSPYTMLAGPANIFLDNNFIAKSELSDVSPNEEFTTSLGADQSIRITCQPISVVHGNTGVLTKSNLATYSHVFEVKNTRTDTVGVQVSEQVPLSTDDRIKVAVVEPDLKRQQTRCPLPYGYAVLNDSNNVEWHTTIPPDEQLELRLVYTVEYPLQDDIHGLPK